MTTATPHQQPRRFGVLLPAIATLLCWPVGAAALAFAYSAQGADARGDNATATSRMTLSRVFSWVAVAIGTVALVAAAGIVATAGIFAAQPAPIISPDATASPTAEATADPVAEQTIVVPILPDEPMNNFALPSDVPAEREIISSDELRSGDCFIWHLSDDAQVLRVDCDYPHNAEVIEIRESASRDDIDAILDFSDSCLLPGGTADKLIGDETVLDPLVSSVSGYVLSARDGWRNGQRNDVCMVYDTEHLFITGSIIDGTHDARR